MPAPALGPWPLGIHHGMKEAILVLTRSMEKGRGGGTVKSATAWKLRRTFTKLWESSPEANSDITLSSGSARGRFVATQNPSKGNRYGAFAAGINARMGDVVSQDRAYTLELFLALVAMYKAEWETHGLSMSMHASIQLCFY